MNNRTKATIAGYVGTELRMMNSEASLRAAIRLAKQDVNNIDAFLLSLESEVSDDLSSLVLVLNNPSNLIVKDAQHADHHVVAVFKFILEYTGLYSQEKKRTDDAIKYIRECISLHAQDHLKNIIKNPPSSTHELTIDQISKKIRKQQADLRISATTGRDRSNNVDTGFDWASFIWLHSPEGQNYIFGDQNYPELNFLDPIVRTEHAAERQSAYNTFIPWQQTIIARFMTHIMMVLINDTAMHPVAYPATYTIAQALFDNIPENTAQFDTPTLIVSGTIEFLRFIISLCRSALEHHYSRSVINNLYSLWQRSAQPREQRQLHDLEEVVVEQRFN